jgi:hypothetical protein
MHPPRSVEQAGGLRQLIREETNKSAPTTRGKKAVRELNQRLRHAEKLKRRRAKSDVRHVERSESEHRGHRFQ